MYMSITKNRDNHNGEGEKTGKAASRSVSHLPVHELESLELELVIAKQKDRVIPRL